MGGMESIPEDEKRCREGEEGGKGPACPCCNLGGSMDDFFPILWSLKVLRKAVVLFKERESHDGVCFLWLQWRQ